MLNLLKQAWNYFTSGLESVYHWVLNAIAVVYGYVNRLFDSISRYALWVYRSLETFAHSVDVWVTRTVSWILAFIKSEANAIVRWTARLYSDLRTYVIDLAKWAVSSIDYLAKWVSSSFTQFLHWVISDIWNPLFGDLTRVFAWLTRYGAWLWDIVSNPDKLVTWIARYLLSAWLTILRRWGGPIVRFMIRQAYRFLPDIVSLLEDAISKVL